MSEAGQATSGASLRDQIYRRALADPDFREEFLADPAGTLATMTGQSLPEDLVVVAVEDTPTQINIPIPSADIAAGALQGVAGGTAGGLIGPDGVEFFPDVHKGGYVYD